MTEPAKDLKGIAVGAEPKLDARGKAANRVLDDRESFGSMRSKLVFQALKTNPPPKDRDGFFAAVLRLFASARLSPMAPHIN
jgi:hypothetical protein